MKSQRLRLAGVLASVCSLAVLGSPGHAQFRGLLGAAPSTNAEKTTDGCAEGKSRSAGSRIAGSVLGSLAGRAASRAGSVFNFVPIAGLTDQLTAAIACKLDPEEQKQAAQATLDATRGEGDTAEVAVGSTAEWASATREGVSGKSTVVARNDQDDSGLQCLMVSDVIIVRGEETRAQKRMCRKPPASRYALLA